MIENSSELLNCQSSGIEGCSSLVSQSLTLTGEDAQFHQSMINNITNTSEVYLNAVEYIEMASNECLKTDRININHILSNLMSCANTLVTLIPYEGNPTRRQALQQISVIVESHIAVLLKQRNRMQGVATELPQDHVASNSHGIAANDKYTTAIESTLLPFDSNLTFKNITGYSKAKSILKESLIFPKLFQGIFPFKNQNILLYGPPGTGKTQLAQALANEFNAKCFSISSADILSSWVGESEKFIKNLLRIAKEQEGYSLILFDEIDSLCRQRQSNEEDYSRRIKTELMQQMEKGAHANCKLSIIGITNCPWELDKAFLRRFNKRVYISPPDLQTKKQILIDSIDCVQNEMSDSEFVDLAGKLGGFSCSDICALCCEAMLGPFRELQSTQDWKWDQDIAKWIPESAPTSFSVQKSFYDIQTDQIRPRNLALIDFMKALEQIHGTVSQEEIERFEEFTKLFGVSA
ncbi:Vacuolar protein sorting-associated protein 4-like [Oopsacas minuta]|uniref:Vacuolar protein sorting-associated protein 4-like n=1 Tax=Oopsacas minuta TaxID=111878 RepID=A0AAV7JUB0_9METZ|nr:Vacuolar protein sorting-associated protein 4-like [Oopsacas minuta]